MVIAYHCIFTAYGFWLPNDPRGSWSDFIRNWEILRFGEATKTNKRHSVASRPHDHSLRLETKAHLKYPAVQFTGVQASAIAKGFVRAINDSDYDILACAILPEHVHIVCLRHEFPAERIISHLKARATQQLVAENRHPFNHLNVNGRFPSVWAHRAWKVFLNSQEDIDRAVRYVVKNPLKEGKRLQNWSFVKNVVPFSGRTCAALSEDKQETLHKCDR